MSNTHTFALATAAFASTMLARPLPAKAVDPVSIVAGAALLADDDNPRRGPNPDIAQAKVNSILQDKRSSAAELQLMGHERLLLTDLAPGCQGNPSEKQVNGLGGTYDERVLRKCFSTEFLSACRSESKADADSTPQALASLKICMNDRGAKKLADLNLEIAGENCKLGLEIAGSMTAASVLYLGVTLSRKKRRHATKKREQRKP